MYAGKISNREQNRKFEQPGETVEKDRTEFPASHRECRSGECTGEAVMRVARITV